MNASSALNDVVIAIAQSPGREPPPPGAEAMRLLAELVDSAIASRATLYSHIGRLQRIVGPLHRTLRADPAFRDAPAEALLYLRPLPEPALEDLKRRPLGDRSDAELASLRVDLLAVNAAAILGLHDEIFDELPEAWLPMIQFEEERVARRLGEHHEPTGRPAWALTPEAPLEAVPSLRDEGAASSPPTLPVITVTIELNALSESEALGREHAPAPRGLLEVRVSANRLTVLSGGFLFIDEGCTLSLRWLELDGRTLNAPDARDGSAEASRSDGDGPLVLVGGTPWLPGQWLDVRFDRAGPDGYQIRTRVELPSPFTRSDSRSA